jgi:hypothetical protein
VQAKSKAESELHHEDNDDAEEEMQSRSSGRESRSPVVFNSHSNSEVPEPAKPALSVSDASDDGDDYGEEDNSADDEDDGSEGEDKEQENKDNDSKTILAQVPRSSPPSLPPTETNVKSSQGKTTQRKNLTTPQLFLLRRRVIQYQDEDY